MARQSLEVLSALDKARIQWYHFTTIVIAGLGFFTDTYDLFCITCITKLLGRIYFPYPQQPGKQGQPGTLPEGVSVLVTGVAIVGALIGELVFGLLGDYLGRKRLYGITLIIMAVSAIGSGLSFGRTPGSAIKTLCFFRFWLGLGVGGDYPLSATIMSEYANQKRRGGFMAAVLAMRGIGIIAAGLVSMIVSACFRRAYPADTPNRQVPEADFVWRIILMLGAAPALLTLYWRTKMPETARFTALVRGDTERAATDMAKVLGVAVRVQPGGAKATAQYTMLSREFLRRHGRHLLGTSISWFLVDVAFYTYVFTEKDVLSAIHVLPHARDMGALEEVFKVSTAKVLTILFATFPSYLFTVLLIDTVGRFKIQLLGFFMMFALTLALAIRYDDLRDHHRGSFVVLFALTIFFANFGPTSTTFIVPAELFPARFRTTCHGISAAAGKAGAMVAAFGLQRAALDEKNMKTILKVLAGVNALGVLFTFLVPETKGRSLEEISGEDAETESSCTSNKTPPNEIDI